MSDLNATIFVRPGTYISIDDRPLPDVDYRVVVLHVGDLTIHLTNEDDASYDDDDAVVVVTNRLIDALTTLRDNAHERLAVADVAAVA